MYWQVLGRGEHDCRWRFEKLDICSILLSCAALPTAKIPCSLPFTLWGIPNGSCHHLFQNRVLHNENRLQRARRMRVISRLFAKIPRGSKHQETNALPVAIIDSIE